MALNDFDSLYGFTMPSSSYDDSASPNSDHEDQFNMEDSFTQNGNGGAINESGETSGGQDNAEGETKRKGKRPPSTAERRSKHNQVERQRRESLNGRFMELASALPSMASVKRPSKSNIVAKSLEYVYQTEARERVLREENASLRREVEELRAKLGLKPAAITPAPIAIVSQQQRSPPIVQRERFNSFDDSASSLSASSLLGCSPTSSGSFDTAPMATAQAPTVNNPAFNALFATADPIIPSSAADTSANLLSNPVTSVNSLSVNGMPFHLGLPAAPHPLAAYDPSYLFSMQQMQQHQVAVQQQMNLNMSMPNWPAYNFGMHGMNHPVNSGIDYPANLIFA